MPALMCLVDGCQWKTQDLKGEFANALSIALQGHLQHSHPPSSDTISKPEKLPRPTVSKGISSEERGYFQRRTYREATKLKGNDAQTQLLACCDTDLRRDLYRMDRDIECKDIDTIMDKIKSLCVRKENIMVARLTLHNLHQDRDEGVRNFAARLRGQAEVCKFTAKCTCNPSTDVSFMDQMIRDVLIRGLNDLDIQQEVLGHENQDLELEQTISLIEAKESGRRSQVSLIGESAHAASQSRKRTKKVEADPDRKALCQKCTQQFTRPLGYGGKVRPYKMCKQCFQRSKTMDKTVDKTVDKPDRDETGSISEDGCHDVIAEVIGKVITLRHHVFDNVNGWQQRQSLAQPTIAIAASAHKEDYAHFGAQLTSYPQDSKVMAIADTGCQSCLIGLKVVQRLGFTRSDLLPVEHRMSAANRMAINIIGAVILRLKGTDSKQHIQSKQICYVTPDTEKFFLSRETCIDLCIIPPSFPIVGEAPNMSYDSAASVSPPNSVEGTTNGQDECKCPKRSLPPPIPTTVPFPPNDSNVNKLKEWLLDYYKASTFNICPHSQLPLMTGPPLALMVDPEATPVAIHSPIPVPLHWQKEVKAGLDRDVNLGVIEPVPVGEPVTWCHRMVVCKKKNGKPRRTVDLQALNTHCKRETHHTASPFHQAMSVPRGKKKTVFDAWNGYHSVPIRDCDRHLTTFITPWGRYRYCTTPQGYIASGDGYTRRFDEIVADFPCKTKCIDDTCMWSDTIEESFFQACQWLDLCGRNGITLNPEKFNFAQDTVEFAGFEITPNEVRPCNRLMPSANSLLQRASLISAPGLAWSTR